MIETRYSPKTLTFQQFLSQYAIYFAPILCIAFLVAESYQMDFRPFYIGGRSVVLGLDPYINPVGSFPELYAAGNAEANPASGFRYPPFAGIVFAPLGLIPSYEVARIIFSLLMVVSFVGVCFLMWKHVQPKLSGSAILFGLCSFPMLGLFERGQIDILLVLMMLASFFLYQNQQKGWAAALLALTGHLKVFPIFLLIYYLVVKRDYRFVAYTVGFVFLLFAGSYLYFGGDVYGSFLQRSLPTVFGPITLDQPIDLQGQGVVHNYIVLALQGNGKIFAHDFVIGRMNPFFFTSSIGALIFGTIFLLALFWLARKQSDTAQFFSSLTAINLLNAIAWIMGVVWYLPLFFYLYDQVNMRGKALLLIPLFLPPVLNANAYAAALLALFFCGWGQFRQWQMEAKSV